MFFFSGGSKVGQFSVLLLSLVTSEYDACLHDLFHTLMLTFCSAQFPISVRISTEVTLKTEDTNS